MSAPNVTQAEEEYSVVDSESTPTHRPVNDLTKEDEEIERLKEESEVIDALKRLHDKEMSELRKYFEGVCAEMEQKYRAEVEDRARSLSGHSSDRGLDNVVELITEGLDLDQQPLDLTGLDTPRSTDNNWFSESGGEGERGAESGSERGGLYGGSESVSLLRRHAAEMAVSYTHLTLPTKA